MQKIDKTDTLETILTNGRFEVDYYQRKYRWGRTQVEQMISMIRSGNTMTQITITLHRYGVKTLWNKPRIESGSNAVCEDLNCCLFI